MNIKKIIALTFSLLNFTTNFGAEGPRVETFNIFNTINMPFDVSFFINGKKINLETIKPYEKKTFIIPFDYDGIVELYNDKDKYL